MIFNPSIYNARFVKLQMHIVSIFTTESHHFTFLPLNVNVVNCEYISRCIALECLYEYFDVITSKGKSVHKESFEGICGSCSESI